MKEGAIIPISVYYKGSVFVIGIFRQIFVVLWLSKYTIKARGRVQGYLATATDQQPAGASVLL